MVFVGWICFESASADASCLLPAAWLIACVAEPGPSSVWSALWSVEFLFPAAASAPEKLTCVTEPAGSDLSSFFPPQPQSPPTETGAFVLVG